MRTTEALDLPTPELIDGKAETVVVDPSDRLGDYVSDLAARAERIRNRAVDPSEDNMLKVTGDGRRAALDLRLVGEDADHDGGKLVVASGVMDGGDGPTSTVSSPSGRAPSNSCSVTCPPGRRRLERV